MTGHARIGHVRVEVDAGVDATLLAAALRSRLSGGDWIGGAENDAATAVLRAVTSARAGSSEGVR